MKWPSMRGRLLLFLLGPQFLPAVTQFIQPVTFGDGNTAIFLRDPDLNVI